MSIETMTREKMVLALTRYELDWYVHNSEGYEDDTAEFFAKGGFTTYTDEQLLSAYRKSFEDEEFKKRNVAGQVVEPPNRDEWVNWGRK